MFLSNSVSLQKTYRPKKTEGGDPNPALHPPIDFDRAKDRYLKSGFSLSSVPSGATEAATEFQAWLSTREPP